MKQFILFFSLLLASQTLMAQVNPNKYKQIYQRADSFFVAKDYYLASKNFDAAKIYANTAQKDECDKRILQCTEGMYNLMKAVRAEKAKADSAKQMADSLKINEMNAILESQKQSRANKANDFIFQSKLDYTRNPQRSFEFAKNAFLSDTSNFEAYISVIKSYYNPKPYFEISLEGFNSPDFVLSHSPIDNKLCVSLKSTGKYAIFDSNGNLLNMVDEIEYEHPSGFFRFNNSGQIERTESDIT